MAKFMLGIIAWAGLFVNLQANILPCGYSCRQSMVRTAVKNPMWMKNSWEKIADEITGNKG